MDENVAMAIKDYYILKKKYEKKITNAKNKIRNSKDLTKKDKRLRVKQIKKTCINCHGPAGKGAASYPKISGNDPAYVTEKLETYRSGTEIGPNSGLMIMMAKPLTDEEISNLAAYLKDAKYEVNQ